VAKGIYFELAPTETPRGTQAMFRDPDGNALLLWEHQSCMSRMWHLRNQPLGQRKGVEGVRSS